MPCGPWPPVGLLELCRQTHVLQPLTEQVGEAIHVDLRTGLCFSLDLFRLRVLVSRLVRPDWLRTDGFLVDGLVVTYEKGLRDSNLGALIESLTPAEAPDQDKEEAKKEKSADKSEKKVVIEKLSITDSKMNVSMTGLSAVTGGGSVPLPLPPITLTDLGKEKEGVTVVEAIQRILTEIAGAAGTDAIGMIFEGASKGVTEMTCRRVGSPPPRRRMALWRRVTSRACSTGPRRRPRPGGSFPVPASP